METSPQLLFIAFTVVIIVIIVAFAKDFTVAVLVITLLTNIVVISAQLHTMYRNISDPARARMSASRRPAARERMSANSRPGAACPGASSCGCSDPCTSRGPRLGAPRCGSREPTGANRLAADYKYQLSDAEFEYSYPGAVDESDIFTGTSGNGLNGTSEWADPRLLGRRGGHRLARRDDEHWLQRAGQDPNAPTGWAPRDWNPIFSLEGAPPCFDDDAVAGGQRGALDGDEQAANQALQRNDPQRPITGAIRADADYFAQYLAEELAEEEDSIWWGRGD